MTVRPLRAEDVPILEQWAEASGYPYPRLTDDPLIESVCVVVDADDRPLAACVAKRIVELYLYCPRDAFESLGPTRRMRALQLLHSAMPHSLIANGYTAIEAFLPPQVAEKFGRRLERSFGWVKNWPSWGRRL